MIRQSNEIFCSTIRNWAITAHAFSHVNSSRSRQKIKQFQRILTLYTKVKEDTTQDKKDFWGTEGTKRDHSGRKGRRGTFSALCFSLSARGVSRGTCKEEPGIKTYNKWNTSIRARRGKDTIVHHLSTPRGVKKSLKSLPKGLKKSLKPLPRGVRKAANNIKHCKTTADSVPEWLTLYGDDEGPNTANRA